LCLPRSRGQGRPSRADRDFMRLECLSCGTRRSVSPADRRIDAGECRRCGYVGWARVAEISEQTRYAVSERLLKLRAA
jgi:ribosomal protein L40E